MLKVFLAGAVALASLTGLQTSATAGPMRAAERASEQSCRAVFDRNRTAIEKMVFAHQTDAIPRMFTSNGCPAPGVMVSNPNAPGLRLICHYKFPATILCDIVR